MAGAEAERPVTRRIFIRGMVQGVGMRPFLALLARDYGLSGTVKNIGSNVELIATADAPALDAFVEAIRARKPEMAEITSIETEDLPSVGAGLSPGPSGHPGPAAEPSDQTAFTILPSSPGGVAVLPPDFPVCADCAREFRDPANRRYRHPFVSCAVCGPRYSILESAPYDRHTTSMADFPMCPDCAGEYEDPADRRYHAQTVSCHNCGPVLAFQGRSHESTREEALGEAIERLKAGGIVAVKGVGGYHLACSPYDEQAVRRLRALKGRELKPFAVMFQDMADAQRHCRLTQEERELLLSPARPIVLLETPGRPFAPSVSVDAVTTGAFLPYTPLQMLLTQACGPLVMTSANQAGKPEIHEDAPMLAMLQDKRLDGVLHHGRRIVTRLDDSVARVTGGQRRLIRRARGYAPRPVALTGIPGSNIIAYGSDLKSAFCLLSGADASMSQYFGDMDEREVQQAYLTNLEHMQRLYSFRPGLAACDLHPGYHASRLARSSGLPLIEVQHHHAHTASVMAEYGLTGPVIGVAFDGTGYGEDGAVWGGEFLLCERGACRREAHLGYVALAGGDSVAVDARKAALCYCEAAGIPAPAFEGSDLLLRALRSGVNTARYSGMGRLFDAVSSLLGLCHRNDYEGRCAVALENAAQRAAGKGLSPLGMDFRILQTDDRTEVDVRPVIRAIAGAGESDEAKAAAALGFHDAVCRMALGTCLRIREKTGVDTVALSGGTFQNARILSGCVKPLQAAGFRVYANKEVPCNDGGLALGQAYVAAMRQTEG